MNELLFKRAASLVIFTTKKTGLDLSQMRFKFKIEQSDFETPNTAAIRVYNLSTQTMDEITGKGSLEYSTVTLEAGYENSEQYGLIFSGSIKQFRRGRENNIESYLDILAADNDIGYNFKVISTTSPAGSTREQRVKNSIKVMGIEAGHLELIGGTFPRPKVQFGLARIQARAEAESAGASWSVQNGALQMFPLTGFVSGEPTELNSFSGMVGVPEQTDEGIKIRSLLNPRFVIGGRVRINNKDINQTFAAKGSTAALSVGQLAYNAPYGNPVLLANVTADGIYRIFVVEHVGDIRGNEWYSDLVCLAFDSSSGVVPAYG